MALMKNTKAINRPAAIRLTEILIYLAAIVNIINGIYWIGSSDSLKRWLCVAMIVVGVTAAFIGFRLQPCFVFSHALQRDRANGEDNDWRWMT